MFGSGDVSIFTWPLTAVVLGSTVGPTEFGSWQRLFGALTWVESAAPDDDMGMAVPPRDAMRDAARDDAHRSRTALITAMAAAPSAPRAGPQLRYQINPKVIITPDTIPGEVDTVVEM